MFDNTVVTEANGGEAFYKYLIELTGLKLKFIRPDHNGYYDAVASAFASGSQPDVVILSSDYYALYASNGFLWNMTDAWENSDLKEVKGRLIATADNIFNALKVNGEDGTKAMYGFSPYRGNGCCTFIKESWLKASNIDVAKVQGVTMDWNTYYGYLKQMAADKRTLCNFSSRLLSQWKLHIQTICQSSIRRQSLHSIRNASGQFVDGFSEKAMQDVSFRDFRMLSKMVYLIRLHWVRRLLMHVTSSTQPILLQSQVYSHTGLVHGLIH